MEFIGLNQRQIISVFMLTVGLCVYVIYSYISVIHTSHILSESSGNQNIEWKAEITTRRMSTTYKRQGLLTEMLSQLDGALQNATERFTILIWEPPFGAKRNFIINSKRCGSCDVTFEKNKLEDPKTKAIVFHFNEVNVRTLPKKRRADQFYVWWTMESTRALKNLRQMTLKQYDGGVFNLTMSYRQDSDVYFPYNSAPDVLETVQSNMSQNKSEDLNNLLKDKDNLALWIVSNCGTTKGARDRLKLSEDLVAAGLRLDRRGGCFPKQTQAPRNQQGSLIRKTKFYLSFENNHYCKDYITEKFFSSGLLHGAVPVVWGAKKSDYERIAPPNSFIFVEDFPTSKDLVYYLNYLDKNNTAYEEYLSWRYMEAKSMPNYNRSTGLCQLCRILHGINIDNVFGDNYEPNPTDIPFFGLKTPRSVPSLATWFYGYENRECALGI